MKKKQLFILLFIILIIIIILVYNLVKEAEIKKNDTEKVEFLSEKYILGEYVKDKRFDDFKYFPLAMNKMDINNCFYYENSFGTDRTYGGNRKHEGCDIMTKDNISGKYPVISVCDGVVEKLGWLELGGYRVGIRSNNGIYYYYAHLSSYAHYMKEGMTVKAGDIIGFCGDTGYGTEGTTGKFDVHLHFGIYATSLWGDEVAINPYPILNKFKKKIVIYNFNY